ncbi:heavy metal-responsive transcriptional regulator [Solilutibacter silvestris]|uniref:heavy metal-responsive transcriptional regulator n=1 Tax=Solilutibacter silvestris TaxID=1645665 RepID=UPI003D32BEFE
MKIGQLAQRAEVNIDTVRYYEREGLLPKPERLSSGYRIYGEGDVKRLRFVRRAKALGFTLPEIRELLELSSSRDDDMAAMKSAALDKIVDIKARIAELERMRVALEGLTESCPGHGALDHCPILNALSEDVQ